MLDDRDRAIRRRAKVMMRRRFRGHRQTLPEAAVKLRSIALCDQLLSLDVIDNASDVALFWPMLQRNEVDLRPFHHALHERGCSLYCPRVTMESGEMHFHLLDDPDTLVEGAFGTAEPPADAPQPEVLDVIIVPGLAFDPQGYRIGYGGGFYDRTLPKWCPPATAIGVAFDLQLASEVPREPWDVPVDMVVTDRRLITIGE